jgi:hypothetical protein
MILASLGKLSVQQAITAADEDSTNVIQIAVVDWAAMTDLWWVIQTTTIAAGDSADTFAFSLVMSQETTLDTNKIVAAVNITGIADKRLATTGRFIAAFNIGKQMKQMLEEDASDYPYIGQTNVLSTGATVSINSNLSFTEPHTIPHRMVVESNIDNSIAVASAGSGA